MADLDDFEEASEGRVTAREIHLADYWAIVVKRRRLIAVCLAAGLVGGVLATRPDETDVHGDDRRRRGAAGLAGRAVLRRRRRHRAGLGVPAESDPSSCRAGRSRNAWSAS